MEETQQMESTMHKKMQSFSYLTAKEFQTFAGIKSYS